MKKWCTLAWSIEAKKATTNRPKTRATCTSVQLKWSMLIVSTVVPKCQKLYFPNSVKWTQGIQLQLQHVLISTCLASTVTMELYESNRLISYLKNFLFQIYSTYWKPRWMLEVMPFCNPTCWKQEWNSNFRNCDITNMYLYCVQLIVITVSHSMHITPIAQSCHIFFCFLTF